jgi:hypothetical protein
MGGYKKHTIAYIKEFIKDKHPKAILLSTKYINNGSNLDFICENNHKFSICFSNLLKGQWCKKCCSFGRLTYKDVVAFIQKKHPGATLLSTEYVRNKSKLDLICENGHKLSLNFSRIKDGAWCLQCNGKPQKSLKIIDDYLKENHPGSVRLTDDFAKKKKLELKCCNNHLFELNYRDIMNGAWCPKCSRARIANSQKHKIEDVIAFIDKYHNGSKLISKEYVEAHSKLEVKCNNGHLFKMSFANMKSNRWCAECLIGSGERFCKLIFEKLFDSKFEKTKPRWLKNPETNYFLELDGYCKDLGIAFEYQGEQHFRLVSKYKMTEKTLEKQKNRDEFKRNKCKELGIILIVVPHLSKTFRHLDIISFIKDEYLKLKQEQDNLCHTILKQQKGQ